MINCPFCGYTEANGVWGYSVEYPGRSEYRAYCSSCGMKWTAIVSIDRETEVSIKTLAEESDRVE